MTTRFKSSVQTSSFFSFHSVIVGWLFDVISFFHGDSKLKTFKRCSGFWLQVKVRPCRFTLTYLTTGAIVGVKVACGSLHLWQRMWLSKYYSMQSFCKHNTIQKHTQKKWNCVVNTIKKKKKRWKIYIAVRTHGIDTLTLAYPNYLSVCLNNGSTKTGCFFNTPATYSPTGVFTSRPLITWFCRIDGGEIRPWRTLMWHASETQTSLKRRAHAYWDWSRW